jgi:hypothetical protein
MKLNLVHVMIITGVLAIVFAVLTSDPLQSVLGIGGVMAPLCGWFLFTVIRPNPLKQVLADLPVDPAEQIVVLEHGLETCNEFDVRTNAKARYLLMTLYHHDNRLEDAIDQGRTILRMRGVDPRFEDEVRGEIATCLDALGRSDEAYLERMAAGDKV